ncbi:MAG TPA: NUDIX hydrolase [Pirellulales bacterium]|nr:NUDIX hydrolase [Pirellulales bacterium]
MTQPSAPAFSLATGEFLELVREGHWEYARRTNSPGAVVLVPVTHDGCLVLIEQYRIPVHCRVIELPAGLIGDSHDDAGETVEDAARRELLEETGFHAWDLRELTSGPPSAGMASEVVTFLLASRLERTGTGGGVHTEQITVHTVPLPRVVRWLEERRDEGVLVDPKVFAGLFFAERFAQGHVGPV